MQHSHVLTCLLSSEPTVSSCFMELWTHKGAEAASTRIQTLLPTCYFPRTTWQCLTNCLRPRDYRRLNKHVKALGGNKHREKNTLGVFSVFVFLRQHRSGRLKSRRKDGIQATEAGNKKCRVWNSGAVTSPRIANSPFYRFTRYTRTGVLKNLDFGKCFKRIWALKHCLHVDERPKRIEILRF